MPYIKKADFEFLRKRIHMRKDQDHYNQLFDDYIRQNNYELWGFAHSDIKLELGMTKPWDKGSITFSEGSLKINDN